MGDEQPPYGLSGPGRTLLICTHSLSLSLTQSTILTIIIIITSLLHRAAIAYENKTKNLLK